MQIIATQKNVRQTPRKLRLVANQIKSLPLEQALKQLAMIERRSTIALLKTIRQAIADAQHNHGLAFADLKINSIMIGDGTRLKRFRAASRGRAHSIIKRSSHIRVVLESERAEVKQKQENLSTKVQNNQEKNKKTEVKEIKKVNTRVNPKLGRTNTKSVGRTVKAISQRTTNK